MEIQALDCSMLATYTSNMASRWPRMDSHGSNIGSKLDIQAQHGPWNSQAAVPWPFTDLSAVCIVISSLSHVRSHLLTLYWVKFGVWLAIRGIKEWVDKKWKNTRTRIGGLRSGFVRWPGSKWSTCNYLSKV